MSAEPESTERPPVRVWRRLGLLAVAMALCVTAIAYVRSRYESDHAANELRELLAELDAKDPGWRLDSPDEPPPGPDSAEVAVRAAALISPKRMGSKPFVDLMRTLPRPSLLTPERANTLAEEMAKLAPAAAQARLLADLPFGRLRPRIGTPLWERSRADTMTELHSVTQLLSFDALQLAQQRDAKGALAAARGCINTGRAVGDQPSMLTASFRAVSTEVGLSAVERTLALGEAADADLAEVQKLLRLEESHPMILAVMRVERAIQHSFFEAIEKGEFPASALAGVQLTPDGGSLQERWYVLVGGSVSPQRLRTMEILNALVEAARLPPHEQPAAEAAVVKRSLALPDGFRQAREAGMWLTQQTPALRRALGLVRVMDALVSVERYRLRNGLWPDKLDDIPKELLPSVPLDPYDGKPLRYKRTADGVVVYLVGENLRDDGGAIEWPARGTGGPADRGYRLWDVTKRRQPAPKPAVDAPGLGK